MTIYYVRPTNGSDAAAGTSFATAFQTSQKAFDTAIAGDEIRLCNEAAETPAAQIDLDINASTAASPILVVAGDSIDGTPLTTGFYTISGASLPATTDLLVPTINNLYMTFKRVRFTAGTRDGIAPSFNNYWMNFLNCRIDTFASDGIYITTTGGHWYLFNCEIDNNTGQGLNINAAGRGNLSVVGGSTHDNGGIGLEIGGDSDSVSVDLHEVYGNGGDGIQLLGLGSRISNTTVYNNTGDGVFIDAAQCKLHNVTCSSNSAYGFNISTNGDDSLDMDYNHTYNNTSGASNITLPGDNNQTGDPQFANVTAGSEDFRPKGASPLVDNGVNGVDIGSRKATGFSKATLAIGI
jgi:hypothetical protein